jgi:hypothetical protein
MACYLFAYPGYVSEVGLEVKVERTAEYAKVYIVRLREAIVWMIRYNREVVRRWKT